MKYFHNQKCTFKHPVVCMGTFDGVHLGHQKLLKTLRQKADEVGGEAIAITYYHHPLETIHKKTFPYLLTESFRKEELLKEFGVDKVLYLDFDQEMANLDAESFLEKIIIGELKTKELVVGYDTHFGKFREGSFDFLNRHTKRLGYNVSLVEPFKLHNRIISSSLIRDFVREGDLFGTARCLGRQYSIIGTIVSGQQIGRDIGFPTINVFPLDHNKLVPGIGVYICEVRWNGQTLMGTTNIGYSPTLKKNSFKEIETHILDFSEDIYSQEVEIVFHRKLRDEKDFSGMEELIQEIQKDVQTTRDYFKGSALK
jgi:riboflavin kinase / FMN adenylyltransferase